MVCDEPGIGRTDLEVSSDPANRNAGLSPPAAVIPGNW